ncbi:MAG TPA: hypothetical protein VLD37_07660 [Candidatus Bilamarchaeum sp.]|nr:hypothetical protein [Candidatus Bilamarchaeum sp.]
MDRHSLTAAPRTEASNRPSGFRLAEPIAEPPQKRRYIKWSTLDEAAFMETVRAIVAEKGIRSMGDMKQKDNSMFRAVKERGLEDRVKFSGNSVQKAATSRPDIRLARENVEAKDSGGSKAPEPVLCRDEARELAQLFIDEGSLESFAELEILEPEISHAAASAGAIPLLVFAKPKEKPEAHCAPPEEKTEARRLGEDDMYRRIMKECFRMGTGSPYVGSVRCTIPRLKSAMNRKLSGPDHRLFKKCWDRMAAEGVIVYNTNCSAASIDTAPEKLRDEKLAAALAWAVSEQVKACPGWRGAVTSSAGC